MPTAQPDAPPSSAPVDPKPQKVVLEVKGEPQLRALSEKLLAAGVAHHLWVEQPEGFATCLATKPYRRSEAGPHFRKLQLCKAALGGGGG
jgi:hypothetical protein